MPERSRTLLQKGKMMNNWKCVPCGYVYRPENGDPVGNVAVGTPFEELPDEWICPVCGFEKDRFKELVD